MQEGNWTDILEFPVEILKKVKGYFTVRVSAGPKGPRTMPNGYKFAGATWGMPYYSRYREWEIRNYIVSAYHEYNALDYIIF